jgi:hypothetical protein
LGSQTTTRQEAAVKAKAKIATTTIMFGVFALSSAYAATVDNPGAVTFTANVDSKLQVSGASPVEVNRNGTMSIVGTLDSSGNSSFDQLDISFEQVTDASNYTHQLQATSSGTGTYCPNSGQATITFSARVKITKVNSISIATTPCYITIDGGSAFTLTTETSGTLTGVRFKQPEPKLVARVSVSGTLAGATCPTTGTIQQDIRNHYGLPSAGNTTGADFQLFHAAISPTNFTGTGC